MQHNATRCYRAQPKIEKNGSWLHLPKFPVTPWNAPRASVALGRHVRGANRVEPKLNYETKPIRSFLFNKSSEPKPNSAAACLVGRPSREFLASPLCNKMQHNAT